MKLPSAVFLALMTLTFFTSFSFAAAPSVDAEVDYKALNEALIEEFEAKPFPGEIKGHYVAGYRRVDGSGEFGKLFVSVFPDSDGIIFLADIQRPSKNGQSMSSAMLSMSAEYYFDGAALKVKNKVGDKKLFDDTGAAISVVSKDHFRVHYYDRDGKRQVLDYLKVS